MLGGTRNLPGPGSYNPVDVTNTTQMYSIKGKYKVGTQIAVSPDGTHEKIQQSSAVNVPGPGTYSTGSNVVFRSNGNCKFGSETRPGMECAGSGKLPGPNSYKRDAKTAVMKAAPSFGFGSSLRPSTER